jgi:general secretion pathway protein E
MSPASAVIDNAWDLSWFARASSAARAVGQAFAQHLADQMQLSPRQALESCFNATRLESLVFQPRWSTVTEAASRGAVVAMAGDQCWLVVSDPFDQPTIDWAEAVVDAPFQIALALPEDIRSGLEAAQATEGAIASALEQVDAKGGDSLTAAERPVLTLESLEAERSPVVRLVNSMIYDALRGEASDIHLESDASGMEIKVRLDGVLARAGRIETRQTAEQVVSRIKVLAELDIAERRIPQDGRFQVACDGREVDIRVSIMPAVHGEDAVLRVLDKSRLTTELNGLSFESLGFDASTISQLRALSRMPHGMLLVTGPTGSGKTTTLYAALCEVNDGKEKIVTIEDPVEYHLAGVVQVPVNEKRGITFSRGLRSILRHDPDKIMVGEIRDAETAQIAVQSALTGHLVFTTVHANTVFDVVGRLLHIGVDPFNLVSALNGVVAQRLVRMNCMSCCRPVAADLSMLPPAESALLAQGALQAGPGCPHCRGTGFKGRKAVAEVLILDDALRDAIVRRQSLRDMKEAARKQSARSLRRTALELVAQGLTTLEEVDRVSSAQWEPEGGSP